MISFTGMLGGGLEGAGNAIASTAQDQLTLQNRGTLAQQLADIDVQKDQRIDENKLLMQNQQRAALVQRLAAAKTGLVGDALQQKYGPSLGAGGVDNSLPDGSGPSGTGQGFSDARQSAQDASVAADKYRMNRDPDLTVQAGIQSGDIDPRTLALIQGRSDVATTRAGAQVDAATARGDAMRDVADTGAASREKIAQEKLQAAAAKVAKLNPTDKAQLEQARSIDRDIAHTSSQIQHMKDALTGGAVAQKDRAATQAQIDSMQNDVATWRVRRDGIYTSSSKDFKDAMDALKAADQTAPGAPNPPAPPRAPGGQSPTAAFNAYQQFMQTGN